jgi:hypothetical protein
MFGQWDIVGGSILKNSDGAILENEWNEVLTSPP